MARVIKISPNRTGSLIVTMSPRDENGSLLLFAQLINPQGQLMKINGGIGIIQSDGVDLSYENSNMTSLEFALTGNDLEYVNETDDSGRRILGFKCQYNSTAGSGLWLRDEIEFNITDLLSKG